MSVKEMQELVDSYHYWDARVLYFNCNHFADEVELGYKYGESVYINYSFLGCYKSVFDHVKGYDKLRPAKEMTLPQIPYFFQDVKIGETKEDGVYFYTCKINMFPLYLEIWCKDIQITKSRQKA
jgi:hypothetical protein